LVDAVAEAVTIRERHSSVLAPWDDLETRLLRRLSDAVLREEVIDYAVEGIREELRKRFEELNAGLGQMRQMKRQIEGEVARLVQAIAENPRYFLARNGCGALSVKTISPFRTSLQGRKKSRNPSPSAGGAALGRYSLSMRAPQRAVGCCFERACIHSLARSKNARNV
jgi:hypothetical protein